MQLGLSGWRRIGIILSVIWFIAFGLYFWIDGNRRAADFLAVQFRLCLAELNIRNESLQYLASPEEKQSRQASNWESYQKCKDEASAFHLRSIDENRAAIPLIMAADFGLLLLLWLIAWLGNAVVRWVVQGFHN